MALLAALVALAAGTRAAAAGPPTVVGIELRAEQEPAGVSLPIAVGEPLSREAVREGLRRLQAAGVSAQIEAWSVPAAGGVELVFRVWPALRVEAVRIEGELGLDERRLRERLEQRPGQPLSESRVVRGVYRLLDLLRDRGFLDARVRVAVESGAESDRGVIVVYRVDSGAAATVSTVRFEGELGEVDPAWLIERLRAGPGARHLASVVRADADRLAEALIGSGYRSAVVESARMERVPGSGAVQLTYPIQPGPRFEIEIEGAEAERLRKRDLLPILGSDRYDDALLAETRRRLVRHYQEAGHYRARVEVEEERADGIVRLRVRVEPGPKLKLAEIEFQGNRSASAEQLEEYLATTAQRRLGGGRRLVDEVLEADLANLRSFYALRGYREARVGPPEIRELGGGLLALTIPIEEGPLQRVVAVTLEGGGELSPARLLGALPLEPGGPYHRRRLDDSLAALRAIYEEEGYSYAQIEAELDWNAERTLVDVRFRVFEGPRTVLDRLVIRGLTRTRPELVREVIGLRPGEVVNTRRLLEVQRRLFALGIFSGVEVRPGASAPFTARRDVIVRLAEGDRNRLAYGLGYDSEDGYRGRLRLSRFNLFGRGVLGRTDLSLGERKQEGRLLLRQPFVGRWELPVTYSLFRIEETEADFEELRQGLQVELLRARPSRRFDLVLALEEVEVEAGDAPLADAFAEGASSEIASLSPSLRLDHRDDPLQPTRGWDTLVQATVAFPLLGFETRFTRLFLQQTGYLPLGRFGVLAASARWGGIEPGGGFVAPALPPELASSRVPISERFFAGGRTAHRAYRRARLAIPGQTSFLIDADGDGEPERRVFVGGNGLALVNLDYRFPIAGPVSGTLFGDSGNVWADWRDIDLDQFKSGVGVGLRYQSALGPLRLEVGWKLDREADESPAVVFVSFGDPF